jgi:hypothetical protein
MKSRDVLEANTICAAEALMEVSGPARCVIEVDWEAGLSPVDGFTGPVANGGGLADFEVLR